MTIAQVKARRRLWKKIDKRYQMKRKDPEASKRRQAELVARERERAQRKSKKK